MNSEIDELLLIIRRFKNHCNPTVLTVDSINNWMVLGIFKDGRNYLQLHSQPGGIVFGRVIELNEEQISKLDTYEKDYFRFSLKTDSGIEVEVYSFENKYDVF